MRIDHVLATVSDPEAVACRLRAEHGLGTVPGPELYGGWCSKIVPMRSGQFIQLLYLASDADAYDNPWARWLRAFPAGRFELIGWAVEVTDLDQRAAEHGLLPRLQAMILGHGQALTWRSLADSSTRIGALPYLVSFDQTGQYRAQVIAAMLAAARHEVEPLGFGEVVTGARAADLRRWLGPGHQLPIRASDQLEALHAVSILLDDGTEALLSSPDLMPNPQPNPHQGGTHD